MTTATAQDVTHEPWCTDHIHEEPNAAECQDGYDACQVALLFSPFGQVNVERMHGVVMVDAYIPNEVNLTAAQAREMATALVKAAEIVEAAS